MRIVQNHYGKSRVRVARVVRQKDRHDFHEMTIAIQLEGDFESSYTEGDNSRVLPTDTMKNTVYALAQDPAVTHPESFGLLLGRHFLDTQPQVTRARIELAEHVWQRHGRFSFTGGNAHSRIARISRMRDETAIEAGVEGFLLLKTAGSAFEGFLKDEYTTLRETRDRILATSLDAVWRYTGEDISWTTSWYGVIKLMTDTFAEHESKSVQHTLYAMGETVLAQCEHVAEIRLTMPNKHYLPVISNDVFCPIDEPHGLIEAVISR